MFWKMVQYRGLQITGRGRQKSGRKRKTNLEGIVCVGPVARIVKVVDFIEESRFVESVGESDLNL